MKKLLLGTLGMCLLLLAFESCKKNEGFTESEINEPSYLVVSGTTLCGIQQYDLMAGRANPVKVGEVEVANDAQNLYVEITPTSPGYSDYRLFVGDCNIVRSDDGSLPSVFQFPMQGTFFDDSAIVTVPLSTLPECFCVVAVIAQPRQGGGGSGGSATGGNSNALLIDYCKQPCPSCNSNNIFGQGGWGAPPHGNNPGTYLYANFSTWFPNGITLGCAGGHTIKLTSPQAVTNFLPQGGTPRSLTQSYVNPTNRLTVLAGHILALTINLASNPTLGNQVITSGQFAGYTVNQLLAEANEVLGGCRSGQASHYNGLMDAINNVQKGVVDCD